MLAHLFEQIPVLILILQRVDQIDWEQMNFYSDPGFIFAKDEGIPLLLLLLAFSYI